MAVSIEIREEFQNLYDEDSSIYWECARECGHALLQELMATGRYSEREAGRRVSWRMKDPVRIFEKAETRSAEEIASKEEIQEHVGDIVGAKVVLDDIEQAEGMVRALLGSDRWEVSSYDAIAKTDGYYAVSHIDGVMFQRDDKMRSELQVRTRLQEAWSKWAHPIYEVVRNPEAEDPPPEILDKLGELGRTLQVADEAGDQVTRAFQKWVEES